MNSQGEFNRIAVAVVLILAMAIYFGAFIAFGALAMTGSAPDPALPSFWGF